MAHRKPPPELQVLRRLFRYDPDTGLFTNLKAYGPRKAGAVAGSKLNTGYISIKVYGEAYQAHRLAWFMHYGSWPEKDIDHINRVKDDNRIANLREASISENYQNKTRYKRKTLSLPGTYLRAKSSRWESYIRHEKQLRFLGSFATETEAHEAYVRAKREFHTFHPEVN